MGWGWDYHRLPWSRTGLLILDEYNISYACPAFLAPPLYLLFANKGRFQKLLSGFFPLRGGGYPPFPLSFFGHNDFPLRRGSTPLFR